MRKIIVARDLAIILVAAFVVGLGISKCNVASAQSVTCVHVPNGANITLQCSNGFWRVITPEGQEFVGMGVVDPNQNSVGGNFVMDRGTGGPSINPNRGPLVTQPTQSQPTVGPGAAELYGNQPRY